MVVPPAQRGALSLGRGHLDEASRLLGSAHGMAARVVDEQVNGPLYADLVELHSWRGDPATALRLAAEGGERLSDHRPPFAAPLAAAAVRAAADEAAGHEPRGEMAGLATAREALGPVVRRPP